MVKDELASSLARKERWSQVALEEHRLLELNDTAAVVTYKATARRRDGGKAYVARASSAYVPRRRRLEARLPSATPV